MSAPYPTRVLGNSGQSVSAIGLGAMGMSSFYGGQSSEEECFRVFDRALELGCNFWDTADAYGPHTNEELIARWFKHSGRRKEVFLATKFGNLILPDGTRTVRGDATYVKEACEGSLGRLGIDSIDLYFAHRIDATTPIEQTVGAMQDLVKQGKVRYLGLSECSSATLRRAHKIHPSKGGSRPHKAIHMLTSASTETVAAIQMEYSPFVLDIERPETGPLLQTCRELNVAVICYSPLGRGFLTGAFSSRNDFEPGDWRLTAPRFSEENFDKNLKVVQKIQAVAVRKGISPSQITLAWLLAQSKQVIPIPGTKRMKYLEENIAAVHVELSPAENQELRQIIESAEIRGERYPEHILRICFGDTPPLAA